MEFFTNVFIIPIKNTNNFSYFSKKIGYGQPRIFLSFVTATGRTVGSYSPVKDTGQFFLPQDTMPWVIFLLPVGSDVEPSGYIDQTADYGQFI
jgi:hypothetical protein